MCTIHNWFCCFGVEFEIPTAGLFFNIMGLPTDYPNKSTLWYSFLLNSGTAPEFLDILSSFQHTQKLFVMC